MNIVKTLYPMLRQVTHGMKFGARPQIALRIRFGVNIDLDTLRKP